jgi:hypothetical protein
MSLAQPKRDAGLAGNGAADTRDRRDNGNVTWQSF